MPVGWRRLVRAVRERGQSEVLGATLLTGIMVILVAMAGLFLFADFGGDEEQLLANIEGDVAAEGITLTHDGGDSFDSADIAVVLTGDNDRDLDLSSDFNASQGGDGQLAPGDVWRYNSSDDLILGSGRMLVIDESTNTVLFDEGYRVEVVPGGVELRVESFNHSDTQSDEADIFGEGDSSNGDDGVPWNYEAFVDFDDDGDPVKNPDEINISFDSSAPLEHNLTDHDLVAYNPSDNPEPVTVTASVDGFSQSDDVNVDVYEVAELSVSIDNIAPVSPSSSPSPFSARSSSVLGTQSSISPIPPGSLVEVKFTVENNDDQVPTLAQEVELSSGAFNETKSSEIDRLDPDDSVQKTLQFNTTATPGPNPELEVKTSSSIKTSALSFIDTSFDATDLVPNAKQQQTFTLDDVQPGMEVTIKPTNAEGAYDNVSVYTDDGSASLSDGDITYEATSLSLGETAKIRVKGVKAGDVNSGPYEYDLTGPGLSSDKSTQSKIARGSGDSGFASVNATGFSSPGKQEQTLSFELSSPEQPIGGDERVVIELTDALGALETGNASVSSVENGETVNVNLDDSSFVVVKLGDDYSTGDTVNVTFSQVKPLFEGEFEAGFSRGANDTASATFEITAQNSSPFGSVGVTDIVPNAPEQQQVLSFTANSSLSQSDLPDSGELINIQIDAQESVSEGDGQVAYGSAGASVPDTSVEGQIQNGLNVSGGVATLGYQFDEDLEPGERVEIRLNDLNVAGLDDQSDPYGIELSPANSLAVDNGTFNVTRSGDAGDAGLSTFTVEDLTGTNQQTLNITFEPAGGFASSNEKVTFDLTDAAITGDITWDSNNIAIVDGQGSLSSNTNSYAAYTTYTPPSDSYSEEVTIELTVDPDQAALDESYTIGVNRGTAGTAGATFGVFQPAQFDVTVKEEESFLGTFYGSESSGLSVTAEIENTATYTDTQTVTLDVGGTQSTTSVNLAGGESKTVTLSLDNLGNGSYTANVSSETDNATTDARVLGTTPDLLAGVETVSGTVGETVQVGVEVVSFDSGSNDVASYFLGFSYDNSKISLDTVKSDDWAKSNSDIGSGEVLVTGFTVGNPETTPAEPAISLGVTLDDSGETTIEFDDGTLPGSTTNRIEESIGERYNVYFVDGNVTVNPSP
jgi:hypothetical protein